MRLPELTTPRCFAAGYASAREAFLDAAGEAGARVTSSRHPLPGPDGEPLYTDVAVLGDAGAPRLLLAVSGTHGVEGFAGSACQVALLRGAGAPPRGVAVGLVHALNPWGFAHLRRTTEGNVDLNRNFVAHASPPANPAYEALHPYLVPDDWNGPAHAKATAALGEVLARDGATAVQSAVTRGQYTCPDGLFYGGNAPAWSNLTWRAILADLVDGRSRVACVDLHTGLGPFAVGEVIFRARYDDGGLDRARAWYGDVTSSEEGSSVSTVIGGTTHAALVEAAPHAEVTSVTLEFGTRPAIEVLAALQADNWLAQRGAGSPPDHAAAVKATLRAAFCPDDETWREAVVSRGLEVLSLALAGLALS